MWTDRCLEMSSSLELPPFFVRRQPSNYLDFLQFYKSVGYVPDSCKASLKEWQNSSFASWRRLDTQLPTTCTGAEFAGRLVSSWGMVPYSKTVIYAHSVCMEKTLAGALTLFYQSIQSLQWLNEAQTFCYYGGSYNKNSAFVTNLQKIDTPERRKKQVRIDAIQFDPIDKRRDAPFNSVLIEELYLSPSQGAGLPDEYETLIGQSFFDLDGLHKVRHYKIALKSPARITGHFIYHDASTFLTASNVLQHSWLFVKKWEDVKYLIPSIRQIDDFPTIGIQVVCERNEDSAAPDLVGEKATEIFWVFTPAIFRAELLLSFTAAFKTLIGKFQEEEADNILLQLQP